MSFSVWFELRHFVSGSNFVTWCSVRIVILMSGSNCVI